MLQLISCASLPLHNSKCHSHTHTCCLHHRKTDVAADTIQTSTERRASLHRCVKETTLNMTSFKYCLKVCQKSHLGFWVYFLFCPGRLCDFITGWVKLAQHPKNTFYLTGQRSSSQNIFDLIFSPLQQG